MATVTDILYYSRTQRFPKYIFLTRITINIMSHGFFLSSIEITTKSQRMSDVTAVFAHFGIPTNINHIRL